MVRLRRGRVVAIAAERPGALELEVQVEGEPAIAIAYPDLTGPVEPGDAVLLNSTAVELGLGTGGVHFVVAVEPPRWAPGGGPGEPAPGRVMKDRYTPLQTAVRAVEEAHPEVLE